MSSSNPTSAPRITLALSLTSSTHSFSSPSPPRLSLTATLHAAAPITVLTWHTVLHPRLALSQNAFQITDLETAQPVPLHSIALSRPPIQRVLNGPDDEYFLTLRPGEPVTVSAGFAYPTETLGRPLPRGDEGRLREASQGRRVERGVCGVDGLEVGRRYRLGIVRSDDELVRDGITGWWWRWGAREEVLDGEGGEGRGVLGQADEEGELSVELERGEVEFETVE